LPGWLVVIEDVNVVNVCGRVFEETGGAVTVAVEPA
jgi:hypothetical protein